MGQIYLQNSSEVITIIFGLTSGILTLVGLASIFISLNSQHKTQYVREILWDLISLPYNFNDYDKTIITKKLFNKIWLYKDITEQRSDFTKIILNITKSSLLIIIFIWTFLLLFLFQRFYLVDFAYVTASIILSSGILLGFIYVLSQINNITKIGNLPSVAEILDASCMETGVNTLTLAAMSIRLKISLTAEEKLQYTIGLPVPFENFSIKPWINSVEDLPDQIKVIFNEYEYLVEIKNDNSKWNLGSSLFWYDILEIDANTFREKITESTKIQVQLDLYSAQGFVIVQFYIPTSEINNIDYAYPIYYWYDNFNEVAMENTSNFAPWSIQHDNPDP